MHKLFHNPIWVEYKKESNKKLDTRVERIKEEEVYHKKYVKEKSALKNLINTFHLNRFVKCRGEIPEAKFSPISLSRLIY